MLSSTRVIRTTTRIGAGSSRVVATTTAGSCGCCVMPEHDDRIERLCPGFCGARAA